MENDLEKANRLCRELALKLDTRYGKSIPLGEKLDDECNALLLSTSKELMSLPLEDVLVGLREELKVGRCIKYNLDDHKEFGLVLAKVTRTLEKNKVEDEQRENTDDSQSGGELSEAPASVD